MINQLSLLVIATLLTACASGSQAPAQTPSPETAAELPTTQAVTSTATAVHVPTQPATDVPTQPATDVPTQPATDGPTQTATDEPTQSATAAQVIVPTPMGALQTNMESFCENLGTHTYCLSAELPAPPATPLDWGAIIGYSPEVFCASDLSIELCGWVTSALLAAIMEWGNYGPVEYWVLGIDVTAAEKLTEVNCQRRDDRKQWNMNDCMRQHSPSGDYGFESYRKIGADAVAAGRPSGNAGLNGARDWGIHYFTSSLPVGFTDYFEVPGTEEQKTIFHEYFHAVQHANIYTEDYRKRDELLGPVWFNEGGAEYMAQYGSRKARLSGTLQQVNVEGRWPFVFEDNMEWKMTDTLDKMRSVCPGVPLKDLTYENNCHNAHYDAGAWAHAYLASKFGHDVLLDTFYLNLEELGWEETFLRTYGMTSDAFYVEFDAFLELPRSEQLASLWLEEGTTSPSGQTVAETTPTHGDGDPDEGGWTMSVEVANFSMAGGVPNLAWLPSEQKLVLTYTESGWKMLESTGDLNFHPVDNFATWLNQLTAGTGFVLAEPIVREDASGERRYFGKRMQNKSDIKRPLYGFVENKNKTGFEFLNGGEPVYQGQNDAFDSPTYYVEVADIAETADGGWRLFYVAKDAYLYSSDPTPQNVRTAYSSDEGLSWDFEFDSPFGETGKTADKRNADPAPLRLSNGSYMAVTMRQHLLYFWSSEDGLNFVQRDEVLGPEDFASVVANGTGLYDPTLALLDDGTIWMVVTVGTSDGRNTLAAASISFDAQTAK